MAIFFAITNQDFLKQKNQNQNKQTNPQDKLKVAAAFPSFLLALLNFDFT